MSNDRNWDALLTFIPICERALANRAIVFEGANHKVSGSTRFGHATVLHIHAIDHLVVNVADLEVSSGWYERVLGMKRLDHQLPSGEIRTSMTFGINKLNLRPIDADQDRWFTAIEPKVGSEDICFLTLADPNAVVRHFRAHDIPIVAGPMTKVGARGPIKSVYVRDPDGNLIEVASYF